MRTTVCVAVSGLPLIGLAGCQAVQSQVVDGYDDMNKPFQAANTPDGLIYFLPRRPFLVSVTSGNMSAPAGNVSAPGNISMSGNVSHTVTVAQGMAEADLRQRFVVTQGTNLVARTELNVTVGTNGLLKTNNTAVSSEVAQALQNAAGALGAITAAGAPLPSPISPTKPPPTIGCPPPGSTYYYPVYPELRDTEVTTFCGYKVDWTQVTHPPHNRNANFKNDLKAKYSGLFYKPELPYLVTVSGPSPDSAGNPVVQAWILTSPDEAEIDFFPVNESFFANNTANITLSDGIITGVDQTTEGEFTSALSLPASVLSSYFSAVGNLLGNLTTSSKDTAALLAQQNATAAAQAQNAVCHATIAANPITANLSAIQLTAAYSAISAACPNVSH